ncbi:hypothetical protein D1007_38992 [Hordeum vulgare]|nr:hypothetical protein D1007_38992 [Hordeum vulgare]
MVDGAPPVVLLYADDTLIILCATPMAAARLQGILDIFTAATGLMINLSSRSLVRLHVEPVVAAVLRSFQFSVGSFPQYYVGLPLSCDKLRLEDFAPLIGKVDRYHSGVEGALVVPHRKVGAH